MRATGDAELDRAHDARIDAGTCAPAAIIRRFLPAMWFRNLLVYRITAPWRIEPDALDASLARNSLQPCGKLATESRD